MISPRAAARQAPLLREYDLLGRSWAPVRARDHGRDAVRGILLLTVILYHNDLVRSHLEPWFHPISFHVLGFFFLSFMSPPKAFDKTHVADYAIRYLVPYFVFYSAYLTLYCLVGHSVEDPIIRIKTAVAGAFVASATFQKEACGVAALWFLPALFSVVLLRSAVDRMGQTARGLVIALGCVVHGLLGAIPRDFRDAVPFGVLIALYVLPLGLVVRWLVGRLDSLQRPLMVAAVATLLFVSSFDLIIGAKVALFSGEVPTFLNCKEFIAADVVAISFFIAAVNVANLAGRLPVISIIGRHSLLVYLVHPLIFQIILRALSPITGALDLTQSYGLVCYVALAVMSVVFTVCGSLIVSATISQTGILARAITPQNWQQWPLGQALCSRLHPRS